jgi:hypothetical protein
MWLVLRMQLIFFVAKVYKIKFEGCFFKHVFGYVDKDCLKVYVGCDEKMMKKKLNEQYSQNH